MKKYFRCPDGEKIEIEKCLQKGGCRLGQRCAPLPYLRLIAREREWTGKPTVTQLIEGTRLAALKILTDYTVDPDNETFAVIGSLSHKRLALEVYCENILAEEPLSDEVISGIPDVLAEDENQPGYYELVDWKFWGSYKISKAKEAIDLFEPTMQLNAYRILFEQYGFPISKMTLVAICKEGAHLWIASKRGIERNLNLIEIPRLDDNEVKSYLEKKRKALFKALKDGYAPRCNEVESWNGRRCDPRFCEVFEECQKLDGGGHAKE